MIHTDPSLFLFKILETRHPIKYNSMGRPSLFRNNSPTTTLILINFILKREWRELNDLGLMILGRSMLIFFTAYLICFFTLIILILLDV